MNIGIIIFQIDNLAILLVIIYNYLDQVKVFLLYLESQKP